MVITDETRRNDKKNMPIQNSNVPGQCLYGMYPDNNKPR
jgi:hypothetical protein